MKQTDRVLEYMKANGSITSGQAMNDLGIMRLASRISDLRKLGYPIVSECVTGQNRFGEPTRWARYRMGARA